MTYEEMITISKNFFNTIDFKKFISAGKEINIIDLMNCIEEYFDLSHPELLPKNFEGNFFNFIDKYEFANYLEQRYGWKNKTEYIENVYIYPT